MHTRHTRETKFGLLTLGDVIVFKTKRGYTGLGWIESLEPDPQRNKEIHAIEYIPSRIAPSLGGTFRSDDSIADFNNRVVELEIIGRLSTREEWEHFIETCKHITMLNRVKKAGFEFDKKP